MRSDLQFRKLTLAAVLRMGGVRSNVETGGWLGSHCNSVSGMRVVEMDR